MPIIHKVENEDAYRYTFKALKNYYKAKNSNFNFQVKYIMSDAAKSISNAVEKEHLIRADGYHSQCRVHFNKNIRSKLAGEYLHKWCG